jgi:uncharacterized glyoxalase superfamily protein PhnB
MVNFSHTILYVKDISRALSFYKDAFDISPKFVHESNEYAELNTGHTALAFASESLAAYNLPNGYVHHDVTKLPLASEIVFTVPDVQVYYEKALKAGAKHVALPQQKPWGQTVAYVQDPNGVLIEIASPL